MDNGSESTLDPELIKDFFQEFDEALDVINETVEKLIDDPNDREGVDLLFRQVHSIKSNLRMVDLNFHSDIVHHLENILEHIRRDEFKYNLSLGDIIRLTLDEVKLAAIKTCDNKPLGDELSCINNVIEHICNVEHSARDDAIQIALNLLDPFANHQQTDELVEETDELTITGEHVLRITDYPYADKDLDYFKALGASFNRRLGYHDSRFDVIADIAIYMNAEAGHPVADKQIRAAAYLHDIGIAMLPLSILEKQDPLDEQEKELYRQHPVHAQIFFKHLPFWEPAAKIILQCHEQVDGQGYPSALKNEAICDGAKILSLAIEFENILHASDRTKISSRTVISAIMDINQHAGTKFSQFWTDVFNNTAKQLHKEKKLIR